MLERFVLTLILFLPIVFFAVIWAIAIAATLLSANGSSRCRYSYAADRGRSSSDYVTYRDIRDSGRLLHYGAPSQYAYAGCSLHRIPKYWLDDLERRCN
ncbi:MAG: hypothetical protein ACOCSK_00390 [Rhodothermales bacterium]